MTNKQNNDAARMKRLDAECKRIAALPTTEGLLATTPETLAVSLKKKRGRPKGSKNKPKAPEQIKTSLKILETDLKKRKGRGLARKTVDLIHIMYRICEECQPITVRGVAYKLFTLFLLPDMSVKSTQKVSRLLTMAREKFMIPWEWIVDESRELEDYATWADPDEYVDEFGRGYRLDFWLQQSDRVHIWSEKGTVRGILAPILNKYGVPFFNVHGFNSATKVMEVARDRNRKRIIVFYVGDYDASGLYMSIKDLPERLQEYARLAGFPEGTHIEIRRIALVKEHVTPQLPSFSAGDKTEDKRFRWFITNYGDARDVAQLQQKQTQWKHMTWHTRCWELDAMDPRDLRRIVENAIRGVIDWETWNRCEVVQKAQ
jgi:hypothetical protein